MDRLERCRRLVAAVDNLGTSELDELFKLLHKNKCPYTRNNHGIFVNLSWLSDEILEQIETYVEFCKKSQSEVQRYESLCEGFRVNIGAPAGAAGPPTAPTSKGPATITVPIANSGAANSSTMKFYLLKKKYGKINHVSQSLKNELEPEEV